MKTDGEQFLAELASLPRQTFDYRFAHASGRLGLGELFDRNELKLLYEASVCALRCNLAFNGIGASDDQVRLEDEANRRQLEEEFMEASGLFYASPGWQVLGECERDAIEECFLTVLVLEDRLAW